jgi:hypothetical protein
MRNPSPVPFTSEGTSYLRTAPYAFGESRARTNSEETMLADTHRHHTARNALADLLHLIGKNAMDDDVWVFPRNMDHDFHQRYEREACWTFVAISPETQLLSSDGSGYCPFLDPDQDLLVKLALDCWYAHPGLPAKVNPTVRRSIPLRAAIELERGEASSTFATICGALGKSNDVVIWAPPEVRGMVDDTIRSHAPVIDVWPIKASSEVATAC